MSNGVVARVLRNMWRSVKWLLKITGFGFLLVLLVSVTLVFLSGDDDFHYPRPETVVNDITGLNAVQVAQVVVPTSVEDIIGALRDHTGPVSIGGGRFSQGGQISYPNSLHLDMRRLNQVLDLNADARVVTVQAGITWRDLQKHIDPYNLSVRIMQTYADFTVGGSLSVNVHGRYIGEGPLVRSVDAIQLVLADGRLVDATPTENSDLFYGAIGGYGGIGVIVSATLQLAENKPIERRVSMLTVDEYAEYFKDQIRDNPSVVFHNADIYPPEYNRVRDVSWYETSKPLTIQDRMIPADTDYWWQPAVALFVASSDFGKWMRQYVLEPIYYMEDRVVWRNWEASYDVRELEPPDRDDDTYVLREYFIPVAQFDAFVPRMAEIFTRHDVNIINVSVRHALADPGTLLAWADEEVFAFVVYYRQGTDIQARKRVRAWSIEMIDAAVAAGGTWYLPYQVFANAEQFRAGYPRADEFFALKRRVDPENRFRNRLWQQHFPATEQSPLDVAKAGMDNYYRGEEQTLLTIPEWYLVFNPEEYAGFLEAGKNPSDFPFFASIGEYWSLYDRVTEIAQAYGYPKNPEYLTMLQVIGWSTTVEYVVKGLYEGSIGRFTRWTAGGRDTPEDLIIQRAQRAYSNLIYDEAWYEFDFAKWIGTIWSETPLLGPELIRKTERKIFFSAEFGVKTLYAKLIKMAAESTYGETDKAIYLTAKMPRPVADTDARISGLPDGVELVSRQGQRVLLSVPRWGGFTRAIPQLAQAGFEFEDVSGNQNIALTLVTDKDAPTIGLPVQTLFASTLVSNSQQQRLAVLARVDDLAELLRGMDQPSVRLEHVFDY